MAESYHERSAELYRPDHALVILSGLEKAKAPISEDVECETGDPERKVEFLARSGQSAETSGQLPHGAIESSLEREHRRPCVL